MPSCKVSAYLFLTVLASRLFGAASAIAGEFIAKGGEPNAEIVNPSPPKAVTPARLESHFVSVAMAVLLCTFVVPRSARAEKPSDANKKSVKILGIGNSFLLNATDHLPGMAKAKGHELTLGIARLSSLQSHYNAALLCEKTPEDPKARLYKYQRGWWGPDRKQKMTLKEMLSGEDWDYVTLQQNSPNSYEIDTYRPYAQGLCDFIKKHAPQAEVVFHQTWPWRPDSSRKGMDKNPPGFMYRELTRCYYTIAREVGIKKIIPVGTAFQLAEESPEWKFQRDPNFDYENPKYPELPKEKNSLHSGWAWRTRGDKKVFKLDGSHTGGGGGILTGSVWHEFFFGEDVREFTGSPRYLSSEKTAALREFAHQAVNGVRPKAWPKDIEPLQVRVNWKRPVAE